MKVYTPMNIYNMKSVSHHSWSIIVALRTNQVNGSQFTPAPSTYYYLLLTHFTKSQLQTSPHLI